MPLRFAWEKPAPRNTLLYPALHFSACAVRFTPLHCIPLDPFPVRHARHSDIARFLSKSGLTLLCPTTAPPAFG